MNVLSLNQTVKLPKSGQHLCPAGGCNAASRIRDRRPRGTAAGFSRLSGKEGVGQCYMEET